MSNETLKYTLYPHQHKNVNIVHKTELAVSGFNQRIAVGMTKVFSAMPTFWIIVAWITLWIIANATIIHFDPLPWPLLLCLASVPQLPLMIVIMVGQGLLSRHQELQADEAFNTTTKIFSDVKTIIKQNDEIIKILQNQNNETKQ